MTAPVRVAAFVAVLLAALVAGLGLGRAVGPLDVEPAAHGGAEDHQAEHADEHADEQADEAGSAAGHGDHEGAATGVTGLQVAERGYRLVLDTERARPGQQPVSFTVLGPDGAPVTSYDVRHDKRLHLVVVRRDLTGFQHVHPTLDAATGRWTTDVDLTAGPWRVLADFAPAGEEPLVLGTDLLVPGRFRPEAPGEQQLAATVDGYDVTLGGALGAGAATTLTLTVSRDGEPVRDLEPYLGAAGHLVALRADDLGYLHVHPEEPTGSGPAIAFATELPSAGRYRLFLDFKHDGVVRTAAFTVVVDEAGHDHDAHDHGADGADDADDAEDETHDH